LSLISSRVGLRHLCTTQRKTSGGTDDYGQPSGNWQDQLVDQPCTLTVSSGTEQIVDATTVAVIEDLRLILPADADIAEQDQVTSVTLRGSVMLDSAAMVRAVLRYPGHIEAVLVKVN
jgi:hypothetical protein